jgi:hypothetical protein
MRIDSSGNVILNQATSRIYGGGTATGRFFLGNSDSKSYMMINGSAHTNPNLIYFVNDAAVTLTLNADNSATFAGNVGIGVTSPNAKLTITGSGNPVGIGDEYGYTGIKFYGAQNGQLEIFNTRGNTSFGNIIFKAGSSESMRIQHGGNVGIGTTSPTMKLHIAESKAGNVGVTVQNTNSSYSSQIRFLNSVGIEKSALTFVPSDTSLRFFHNGSDRMTITSGGDVLVQATSTAGNGLSIRPNATQGTVQQVFNRANSTLNSYIFDFQNNGTTVGYIRYNNTTTAYVTSSDYRLKENVVEMTGALDRVSQLKPSRFNFIADADTTVDGFLAHEVQEIVPEAITGEKDAVDEEGNPDYQGIDQSKLVPLLVGAIQELKAEIDELKK